MVATNQSPRGVAWVWYKENVLRPLKFVFLGFGGFGAFGHMGRDLIEGLEWWVSIVDIYHNWFGVPAAAILNWVLQTPMIWIASWFDFELIPPAFPVWAVDIIVLANIAAGFLVFKRFLTISAQIFLSLLIVLSLSIFFYSFALFMEYGPVGAILLLIFGSYLVGTGFRTQVILLRYAELSGRPDDSPWMSDVDFHKHPLAFNTVYDVYRIFSISFRRPMASSPGITYKWLNGKIIWITLFTYGTIMGLGAMVLLLNQYADVALPPVERLMTAWDSMIQDWMGWAADDR